MKKPFTLLQQEQILVMMLDTLKLEPLSLICQDKLLLTQNLKAGDVIECPIPKITTSDKKEKGSGPKGSIYD